ncbi:MAG: hypothetical protein WCS37_09495 [Chloroflexota bacterium]|nr:hypothetical protein [Chloroflexota bacterium]
MTSRSYTSFLLRFWLTSNSGNEPETTNASQSLVIQLQHLQSGITWKLNNLEELYDLLDRAKGKGFDLATLDHLETTESLTMLYDLDSDVE